MTGRKGLEIPAGPLVWHNVSMWQTEPEKVQPNSLHVFFWTSHPSFKASQERKEKSVLPLLLPSKIQAVGKGLQLLLSQPLLLLQVLLPDKQWGLGLDKALVVLQLFGGQLTRQEGRDKVLSPVQVILQIFGILPLFAQQTVATVQRLLSAETETGYICSLC